MKIQINTNKTQIKYRCEYSEFSPSLKNLEFDLNSWRKIAIKCLRESKRNTEAELIQNCEQHELMGYLSRFAGIDLI